MFLIRFPQFESLSGLVLDLRREILECFSKPGGRVRGTNLRQVAWLFPAGILPGPLQQGE